MSVMTSLAGSGASTDWTTASWARRVSVSLASDFIRSRLAFTAAASTGAPEANFAAGLRWNVYVLRSGLTSQRWASSPFSLPSESTFSRVS